jgi:hypothetical protein
MKQQIDDASITEPTVTLTAISRAVGSRSDFLSFIAQPKNTTRPTMKAITPAEPRHIASRPRAVETSHGALFIVFWRARLYLFGIAFAILTGTLPRSVQIPWKKH